MLKFPPSKKTSKKKSAKSTTVTVLLELEYWYLGRERKGDVEDWQVMLQAKEHNLYVQPTNLESKLGGVYIFHTDQSFTGMEVTISSRPLRIMLNDCSA